MNLQGCLNNLEYLFHIKQNQRLSVVSTPQKHLVENIKKYNLKGGNWEVFLWNVFVSWLLKQLSSKLSTKKLLWNHKTIYLPPSSIQVSPLYSLVAVVSGFQQIDVIIDTETDWNFVDL